jgi:hypothetical protein
VDNWGVETELKVKLLTKRDFTWDVNANYSFNDNKVKSLYGDLNNVLLNRYTFSTSDGSSGFIYAEIGKPFPYLKTTQWQRDAAGKVIVNSVNGYPGISNKEKNWGTTLPKHILGLGTTVKYKNIALSANAEYRGGNYYYHGIAPYLIFTGIGFETGKYNRESFIFPNSVTLDNTGKSIDNTSVPVEDGWYEYWDHYHRRAGENFVTSGAFWKLRDVSITYDFPKKWFGTGKVFKAMTLGVNGRNLVILKPKNNIYGDPEFSGNPDNRANGNGNGVGLSDTGNTPPYRSFGATLNITF